jgi:hypothetical protein
MQDNIKLYFRGQRRPKVFPIRGTGGKTLVQIGSLQLDGRHESACRVYGIDGISPCLNTCGGGGLETKIFINKPRFDQYEKSKVCQTLKVGGDTPLCEVRPCLTPDRLEKRQNGRRFKEHAEMMASPPSPSKQLIDYANKNNAKIRRLTPKECFRLQGFPDEYFERAQAVNSDSQLYKQAGNAVSVPVIYEIARRLK